MSPRFSVLTSGLLRYAEDPVYASPCENKMVSRKHRAVSRIKTTQSEKYNVNTSFDQAPTVVIDKFKDFRAGESIHTAAKSAMSDGLCDRYVGFKIDWSMR